MNKSEVADALLDLFLPRVCISCGALLSVLERGTVCGLCWSRVAALPRPACDRCGHPLAAVTCSWCANLPPFVRAARSYCWFPGPAASPIVAALKYGGWATVAEDVAQRLSHVSWPRDVREEQPLLIPVPLAPVRQRGRGYNQSELIARALGRRWRLPVLVDSLLRGRSTVSQTRLTPEERSRNVAGAFAVSRSAVPDLHRAHVLLVDDVVTTAATLNECARALLNGGVRIVSYVTFGRARAPGDLL